MLLQLKTPSRGSPQCIGNSCFCQFLKQRPRRGPSTHAPVPLLFVVYRHDIHGDRLINPLTGSIIYPDHPPLKWGAVKRVDRLPHDGGSYSGTSPAGSTRWLGPRIRRGIAASDRTIGDIRDIPRNDGGLAGLDEGRSEAEGHNLRRGCRIAGIARTSVLTRGRGCWTERTVRVPLVKISIRSVAEKSGRAGIDGSFYARRIPATVRRLCVAVWARSENTLRTIIDIADGACSRRNIARRASHDAPIAVERVACRTRAASTISEPYSFQHTAIRWLRSTSARTGVRARGA